MIETDTPSSYIADSSALFALYSTTDALHAAAIRAIDALRAERATILTPADVFSETMNLIGRRIGHRAATEAATLLLEADQFIVVETTADVRTAALAKLMDTPDSVSFTDCVAMSVADRYDTKLILGFDQAFRRSGYLIPDHATASSGG